jgi:hypothetical protein
MRMLILASAATALLISSPAFAAKRSHAACVDLALKHGWTYSDLSDNRRAAKAWMIKCMAGKN